MVKPFRLLKGDKIAVVSLSWGGLGDKEFIHRFYIAKERLINDFGLEVMVMPNALKGSEYIYDHPEKRAEDLMDAFSDKSVKAVFCAIGGDDSIRLLPYIDYSIIKANPKIFMGYSDTTVSHFMMNRAGLVSFYGPALMSEFGEYGSFNEYTADALRNILFSDSKGYEMISSRYWSDDHVEWKEENINIPVKRIPERHGYEVLNGRGVIRGVLTGGCIDVFPMIVGTDIWPKHNYWKNKILLIETSEEKPAPELVLWYMRNLGAQGILGLIKGIIVGKPKEEVFYEEYKEVYLRVLREFHCDELPVMYNLNIGHAYPVGVFPLGVEYEIDFDKKTVRLCESATRERASDIRQKVYDYLLTIPKGRVVTYGQIAEHLGNPGLSRAVGNILHTNPDPSKYPCYKVVNSRGMLSDNFGDGGIDIQKQRLERDGIEVIDHRVNLKKYQFKRK